MPEMEMPGGYYIGEVNRDQLPHGQGRVTFENGDTYEGEWKSGCPYGHGTYTHLRGDVYVGEFEGGARHGYGTLKWCSGAHKGDVYVGEFKNDMLHNMGQYTWSHGDVYEGQVADSLVMVRDGYGTYYYRNPKNEFQCGNVYDGMWAKNKFTGRGRYMLACGDVYEGEWHDNYMHGQGMYVWVNGDVFEGMFTAGMGKGTLTRADGTVEVNATCSQEDETERKKDPRMWSFDNARVTDLLFPGASFIMEASNALIAIQVLHDEGELTANAVNYLRKAILALTENGFIIHSHFITSKIRKERQVTLRNGDEYEGWMKGCVMHGHGVYKQVDGRVYQGDMMNNQPNGRGTLKLPSGDVYQGEWKFGKMHGKGVYTYANGDVYDGEMKDDRRDGNGKMRAASGDVYEGEWKDGKKHGRGELRYASGKVCAGKFVDDELREGRCCCC